MVCSPMGTWSGEHGPYRQSERLPLYREAVERLLRAGLAYEAWETSEELQSMREAAQSEHGGFRYRRPSDSPEDLQRFYQEGRAPVIRLRLPDEGVVFEDLILGSVEQSLEDMDEFVIIKADGFPTYHFAVVVDDHHMGITHVLRAQEHLLNTTKHIRLYEALGWEPPAHGQCRSSSPRGRKMPSETRPVRRAASASGVERGGDGGGLGMEEEVLRAFMKKKSDSVDLAEAIAELRGRASRDRRPGFPRAGYLPEALVNFLALLGWNLAGSRRSSPSMS